MRWLRLLVLLVFVGGLWAGTTGKITGRVVDAETGEPLVGANVVVEGTRMGAATDLDGYYIILNVPPGEYTLVVSYVGYQTKKIQGVVVEADRTTEINVELSTEVVTTEVVEVVETRITEAMRPDVTQSLDVVKMADVKEQAVQTVEDVIGQQAGVVISPTGQIHVRGSRPGEVVYVVDGAVVMDPYTRASDIEIPLSAIQEASFSKGGFGAEYGNAAAAVFNIITREGRDRYEANVEYRARPMFLDAERGDRVLKKAKFYYDLPIGPVVSTPGRIDDFITVGDGVPEVLNAEYAGKDWNTGYRRFLFGVGGPFPGLPDLKFYVSGDLLNSNGRFPGFPTNQDGMQWKFTWTPSAKLKFFTSGMYNFRTNVPYSSVWRLAPSGTNTVTSLRKQFVFGFNYLFNPTTYLEVRGGRFVTYLKWEDSEDLDKDGIDDWTDLDGDQRPEVDPGWLEYLLASGYLNEQQYNDLIAGAREENGRIELNAYWWEVDGLYPSFVFQRNNIDFLLVEFVNPQTGQREQAYVPTFWIQDDILLFGEDTVRDFRVVSDPEMDSLVANQYIPDAWTRDRDVWHEDSSVIWSFRADFVSAFKRIHTFKTGVEFRQHEIWRNDIDYASGGNIYVDIVHAKPREFAYYIQDKIEYEGLVANVGVRFDYFDPNALYPKVLDEDPTYLISVIDFRRYPEGGPQAVDSSKLVRATPKWLVSPRIGISHPFTERDVLHFTYGYYFQIPQMARLYANMTYWFTGAFPILGNPNLRPEQTISFEVGFRHAFDPYTMIDVTAFQKDIKDLIQSNMVRLPNQLNVTTFLNFDFASSRGLEFEFERLYGAPFLPDFNLRANLTLMRATGTFSNPADRYALQWAGIPLAFNEERPLDWDRPIQVNVILGYRKKLDRPLGGGVNLASIGGTLTYQYHSGDPWSPPIRDRARALEQMNSLRLPPVSSTDFHAYLTFGLGQVGQLRLYTNIYNLFNNRSVIAVADEEYYYAFGYDPATGQHVNPAAAEGSTRAQTLRQRPRNGEIGLEISIRY